MSKQTVHMVYGYPQRVLEVASSIAYFYETEISKSETNLTDVLTHCYT